MKTSKKIWFIFCLIILTAIFVSSCVCVYLFNLHQVAYWWTLLIVGWAIEIIVAIVLFNGKHMPDESKAFWLVVLLFFPYFGALIVLFLGFDKYRQKVGDSSNLTFLLQALFKANKSIKIYTNSFFVPLDLFNVLNFVSFKDISVQIIISNQKKKLRQKLLKYNIDKNFENKIEINFLDKEINQNFIIIDDKKVLLTKKNFNFKNIYSLNRIFESDDCLQQLQVFEVDQNQSQKYELSKYKLKLFRRLGYAIANIFYLFF